MTNSAANPSNSPILVLGGTGKTGRRVVQRLEAAGLPVRIGSRSASPAFDWQDPSGWDQILEGVEAVYVSFYPDLAVPGAPAVIEAFSQQAVAAGVKRLVLLSGRGEEEAQRCEGIIQQSGVDWTILRCSWFAQNFSEAFLRDAVVGGVVALPVDQVREPFVDADDIAEVAVAALTQPGHAGQLYELTGPRLLSFPEAVAEIADISGLEIEFMSIPHDAFLSGMRAQGAPEDLTELVGYLFREVLDGRNESLSDGVQRALGREPRDLRDYAREAAAQGAWAM